MKETLLAMLSWVKDQPSETQKDVVCVSLVLAKILFDLQPNREAMNDAHVGVEHLTRLVAENPALPVAAEILFCRRFLQEVEDHYVW